MHILRWLFAKHHHDRIMNMKSSIRCEVFKVSTEIIWTLLFWLQRFAEACWVDAANVFQYWFHFPNFNNCAQFTSSINCSPNIEKDVRMQGVIANPLNCRLDFLSDVLGTCVLASFILHPIWLYYANSSKTKARWRQTIAWNGRSLTRFAKDDFPYLHLIFEIIFRVCRPDIGAYSSTVAWTWRNRGVFLNTFVLFDQRFQKCHRIHGGKVEKTQPTCGNLIGFQWKYERTTKHKIRANESFDVEDLLKCFIRILRNWLNNSKQMN